MLQYRNSRNKTFYTCSYAYRFFRMKNSEPFVELSEQQNLY